MAARSLGLRQRGRDQRARARARSKNEGPSSQQPAAASSTTQHQNSTSTSSAAPVAQGPLKIMERQAERESRAPDGGLVLGVDLDGPALRRAKHVLGGRQGCVGSFKRWPRIDEVQNARYTTGPGQQGSRAAGLRRQGMGEARPQCSPSNVDGQDESRCVSTRGFLQNAILTNPLSQSPRAWCCLESPAWLALLARTKVSKSGHSSLVTPTTRHTWYMLDTGRAEQSRAEQEVVLASSIGHASAEKPHSESTKYYITTPSGYGFRNAGVFGDCFLVSTLHAQLPFRATESGDGWKCDCDGDLCPASNDEEKRLPETRWGLFALDTPPRHFFEAYWAPTPQLGQLVIHAFTHHTEVSPCTLLGDDGDSKKASAADDGGAHSRMRFTRLCLRCGTWMDKCFLRQSFLCLFGSWLLARGFCVLARGSWLFASRPRLTTGSVAASREGFCCSGDMRLLGRERWDGLVAGRGSMRQMPHHLSGPHAHLQFANTEYYPATQLPRPSRSENFAVSLLYCKALAVPGPTLPAGLGEESRTLGILVHYGDGTREKHGIPLGLRKRSRRSGHNPGEDDTSINLRSNGNPSLTCVTASEKGWLARLSLRSSSPSRPWILTFLTDDPITPDIELDPGTSFILTWLAILVLPRTCDAKGKGVIVEDDANHASEGLLTPDLGGEWERLGKRYRLPSRKDLSSQYCNLCVAQSRCFHLMIENHPTNPPSQYATVEKDTRSSGKLQCAPCQTPQPLLLLFKRHAGKKCADCRVTRRFSP
ncbi:hypothetical protein BGZ57DRAFT_850396 [Hyaloscypha finlandica]|nr:hypothetical protein BGZ57DRAFT_850396 [Hyaloscypha finlandica]